MSDQTSHSFSDALPLSSHGPAHPPTLPRGKACLRCRNRKLRCDGRKPTCSVCLKSASVHGEDITKVVCDYDASQPRTKKGTGRGKEVALLKDEIADLKALLHAKSQEQGLPSTSANLNSFASTSQLPSPAPSFASNTPDFLFSSNRSSGSGEISPDTTFNSLGNYGWETQALMGLSLFGARPTPLSPPEDPILPLSFPNWPANLPSPTLLNRLVNAYFSKTHLSSEILNRARFMAQLQHPPSHPNFPFVPLLHAVLSIAGWFVSENFFGMEHRYWPRNVSVSEFHANIAYDLVHEPWGKGAHLYEVCQTLTLFAFHAYTSASFARSWSLVGSAARLASPLGLGCLEVPQYHTLETIGSHSTMKSFKTTAVDDDDFFEKSWNFWQIFISDTIASSVTGWAPALDLAEITTLLPPATPCAHSDTDPLTSPLSIRSPDFFTNHPIRLIGPVQLFIKACVLLSRVSCFVRRSRLFGKNTMADPEFQKIDETITAFEASLSNWVKEQHKIPSSAKTDCRGSVALLLPHAARILLLDPCYTLGLDDPALLRSSNSARSILEAVYLLFSVSFEIALTHPFVHMIWKSAARALIRELAIKQLYGIPDERIVLEVSTFVTACQSSRTPLGLHNAQIIQEFLRNPASCLPPTRPGANCDQYSTEAGRPSDPAPNTDVAATSASSSSQSKSSSLDDELNHLADIFGVDPASRQPQDYRSGTPGLLDNLKPYAWE